MLKNRSAIESSTWTSGSITISTTAAYFHGVVVDGSAAASALTIKDGATTKFVVTAQITQPLSVNVAVPVAFTTNITVTNGGTASYAVLFSRKAV